MNAVIRKKDVVMNEMNEEFNNGCEVSSFYNWYNWMSRVFDKLADAVDDIFESISDDLTSTDVINPPPTHNSTEVNRQSGLPPTFPPADPSETAGIITGPRPSTDTVIRHRKTSKKRKTGNPEKEKEEYNGTEQSDDADDEEIVIIKKL